MEELDKVEWCLTMSENLLLQSIIPKTIRDSLNAALSEDIVGAVYGEAVRAFAPTFQTYNVKTKSMAFAFVNFGQQLIDRLLLLHRIIMDSASVCIFDSVELESQFNYLNDVVTAKSYLFAFATKLSSESVCDIADQLTNVWNQLYSVLYSVDTSDSSDISVPRHWLLELRNLPEEMPTEVAENFPKVKVEAVKAEDLALVEQGILERAGLNDYKSGNKGKASGFKLTNKKTNKLAKRGQLDHQKKKRKESLKARKLAEISKARQTAINIKPSGNEEPVVEDEGYFEDANVNFAKSLLRDGDGRQKKKRKNNNEIEALFGMNSKRAKQWTGDDSTPLLPIKDKNKLIQRSLPAESPASVEENVEVSKPLPEVSVVDLFATRAQKLQNRQTAIASMSCAIVENPEENLKKLRTLKEFWDEKDPDIRMGNRKLLLLSLTEIYKDILPDYNIRVASQAEKQQAASKDTKQLRHYEENLLHNYKLYLQMLEECIGKAGDKKQRETADEKTKEFRLLAVRCMTQVFVKRPTFNFSKNVINVLIRYLPFTTTRF
ncbi:NOC3L [Bugula neritina]|uniref:NOC3L n=1 Tax=Bugula neritina TaxID=10212 RepID=A0A7J7J3I9_BUGNE|nr:NOC3L [Bugula neritina]